MKAFRKRREENSAGSVSTGLSANESYLRFHGQQVGSGMKRFIFAAEQKAAAVAGARAGNFYLRSVLRARSAAAAVRQVSWTARQHKHAL